MSEVGREMIEGMKDLLFRIGRGDLIEMDDISINEEEEIEYRKVYIEIVGDDRDT